MKKIVFLLSLLFFLTNFSFGQIVIPLTTEEEDQILDMGYDITDVWNVIIFSQKFNEKTFGVKDRDKIFPGQELVFFFKDGTWSMPIVKVGDTQEGIVSEIFWTKAVNKTMAKEEALARDSLEYRPSADTFEQIKLEEKVDSNVIFYKMTTFGLLIILLIILSVLLRKRFQKPHGQGYY